MKNSILIWDLNDTLPENNRDVLFWQSFQHNESKSCFSIPYLLEKNASEIKSNYLSMVYELGETRINNSRLIDFLEIEDGFSYWWMTLFVEKSNYLKSPKINDILKLLVLNKFCKENSYNEINLVTQSLELNKSIKSFSKKHSISFKSNIKRKSKFKRPYSFKSLYKDITPQIIKGLVYFISMSYTHLQLRGLGLRHLSDSNSNSEVTFVDYLFNFNLKSANFGEFKSNYWTNLPETLQGKFKTNWLHIYVRSESLKSIKDVKKTLDKLNNNVQNQAHFTLSSFISIKLIFKVLLDWFWLQIRYRALIKHFKKVTMHYWPFLHEDFVRSFRGVDSFSNLLFLNLFNEASSKIPTQKKCIYLQENQGWESAFLYSWKRKHNNNIIGYPHATVAFWTLMYFNDPRAYKKSGKCDYEMPDTVAVSGNSIKEIYIQGGYPKNQLSEVESLRFLHLDNTSKSIENNHKLKPQLLVLGDYEYNNTHSQLKLLEDALNNLDFKIDIIFKPHPACSISSRKFPKIMMKYSTDDISILLENCTIAYTGNGTSSAVDAYLKGKKVISVLSKETPNLSPLRDYSEVTFISSGNELTSALKKLYKLDSGKIINNDFFYIDSSLKLWTKLLTT